MGQHLLNRLARQGVGGDIVGGQLAQLGLLIDGRGSVDALSQRAFDGPGAFLGTLMRLAGSAAFASRSTARSSGSQSATAGTSCDNGNG